MKSGFVYIDYLNDMLESTKKIFEFTQEMKFDFFMKDEKTFLAVIRCLEVIGEASNKIPVEFKKKHPEIPWKEISGMRNKLIHEYFGVQAEVIWKTIQEDLPLLKNRLQKLIMEIH